MHFKFLRTSTYLLVHISRFRTAHSWCQTVHFVSGFNKKLTPGLGRISGFVCQFFASKLSDYDNSSRKNIIRIERLIKYAVDFVHHYTGTTFIFRVFQCHYADKHIIIKILATGRNDSLDVNILTISSKNVCAIIYNITRVHRRTGNQWTGSVFG